MSSLLGRPLNGTNPPRLLAVGSPAVQLPERGWTTDVGPRPAAGGRGRRPGMKAPRPGQRPDMSRASTLPLIKVTTAWEDAATGREEEEEAAAGAADRPGQDGTAAPNSDGPLAVDAANSRRRSCSLPPLTGSRGGSSSQDQALAPPASPGEARRGRSLDKSGDARLRRRPKSANPGSIRSPSTATDSNTTTTTTTTTALDDPKRRRGRIVRSNSFNSSTESLPSRLDSRRSLPILRRDPTVSCSSSDSRDSGPAHHHQSPAPPRKVKSTSDLSGGEGGRGAFRASRDNIFRNPSYNPVLLDPGQATGGRRGSVAAHGGGGYRRPVSPFRLSHLSADGPSPCPSPPDRASPSLQDQFEQLKKCRYLRVPSDDSD